MGGVDIGTEVFRLLGYGLVGLVAHSDGSEAAAKGFRQGYETILPLDRGKLRKVSPNVRVCRCPRAEYAHSAEWIDAHLGQFFDVTLLFLGFVSLAQVLKSDSEVASAISTLGLALATVTITLIGFLRASRCEPER